MTAGRIPALRERIEREELDCLLVVALTNIRYLTGFTGSAAHARRGSRCSHARHRRQVQDPGRRAARDRFALERRGPARRSTTGADRSNRRVRRASTSGPVGRVGLEADHVVWSGQIRWSSLLDPAETVATSGMVEALRAVKDEGEIAHIGEAAAIADAALGQVLPMLEQEVTESEFALALDVAMRRLGAEDRAFETIVASGPNSAKPHARPSDRRLTRGDPVVVDFGAMVEGYRSDMTRTFFVGGSPTTQMLEVYEAVLESQRAGVAAVGPGVTGGEVDEVCRRSLAAAGFGEGLRARNGSRSRPRHPRSPIGGPGKHWYPHPRYGRHRGAGRLPGRARGSADRRHRRRHR